MEEIERVARLHRCDSVLLGLSEISDDNHGTHLESLLGTLDANVVVLAFQQRLAADRRGEDPGPHRGGGVATSTCGLNY